MLPQPTDTLSEFPKVYHVVVRIQWAVMNLYNALDTTAMLNPYDKQDDINALLLSFPIHPVLPLWHGAIMVLFLWRKRIFDIILSRSIHHSGRYCTRVKEPERVNNTPSPLPLLATTTTITSSSLSFCLSQAHVKHTHTRTHPRTHARTHARTCTHARTHTHTHTRLSRLTRPPK